MFSLDDLFFVGIALDLTGAAILAMGLLASATTISELGRPTVGRLSEGTVVERIESRADAEIGVAVLGFGFFFQGLGYLLELAGEPVKVGHDRLVAALVMGGVAIGAVLILRRFIRPRRIARLRDRVDQS
ncbi:MAG TPA: hypothetical protein VHS74_00875 [Solirubrobacterales bacterium]|jgi:hypothetical protein|nr:hypothetical protein [Solirubrobacterales bacterium]